MSVIIHGYTGPLQEGDNLTLTCESHSSLSMAWIFTANGKTPKLISQNRTFHKYSTELSDAGQYTCATYRDHDSVRFSNDHEFVDDLSASVQVEVLEYVPDNSPVEVFTHNIITGGRSTEASVTDTSNSVEVFTHNIIIGDSTTDTPVADNRSSVEVFTHNIITGGSAIGVVIIIITVALAIALVQTCRKQSPFTSCKYKLILLIFTSNL